MLLFTEACFCPTELQYFRQRTYPLCFGKCGRAGSHPKAKQRVAGLLDYDAVGNLTLKATSSTIAMR
jgi:hypothetical protein